MVLGLAILTHRYSEHPDYIDVIGLPNLNLIIYAQAAQLHKGAL